MYFGLKDSIVLLYQGRKMVDYLAQHRLYSTLFLPRRKEDRRGIQSPSAMTWALLEETRFYLELQYNENVRIGSRPLRESLLALIGKLFYIFV